MIYVMYDDYVVHFTQLADLRKRERWHVICSTYHTFSIFKNLILEVIIEHHLAQFLIYPKCSIKV